MREVCAGDEAEVFIAGEWGDVAEAAPGEKDGGGAKEQVEVLGVGDERQKGEQGKGVNPPEEPCGGAGIGDKERSQIGGHEEEDQQGDDAGRPRQLCPEPPGPDEETADEEAGDADGAGESKSGHYVEIEAADVACGVEKTQAEDDGAMVESDQRKGAEGPEDGGVGKTWKQALANDFGLAKDLPYEVPHALAEGEDAEAGVLFGFEDFTEDGTEAAPEKRGRGCSKPGE